MGFEEHRHEIDTRLDGEHVAHFHHTRVAQVGMGRGRRRDVAFGAS